MTPSPISFGQKLRLVYLAFTDKRTPMLAKLLIVLSVFYGISPIDFIPDFIPLVGELDDVTVFIIVILIFLRMTKQIREDLKKKSAYDTTAISR